MSNVFIYKLRFDNNVELKINSYEGIDDNIRKMYDFYVGGSLLFREPKKRQIISNLINKKIIDVNKNAIDGGAFLGDTSLPLCLNMNGIVYSIDPGDINIDIIKNLSELNNIKNIKLLKYGLGSKCEKLFYNPRKYDINFCSFNKINGEKCIDCVSLDELHNKGFIENIDFMHIDVENLENEVLKGSENLINMYNPIIIFEGHIKSYMNGVKECYNFLKKMDYIIYMIDEDAGAINDARNFIAVPIKRHVYFINNFDFFHFFAPFEI